MWDTIDYPILMLELNIVFISVFFIYKSLEETKEVTIRIQKKKKKILTHHTLV